MKVTTKGRITIPVEIRKQFGIKPGDEIDFTIEGNTVMLIPGNKDLHGRRIVEHLLGKGTVKMTTDEIMALTRGED